MFLESVIRVKRGLSTHTRAAQADDSQGLQDAGSADNPGESQKQDDPQNVLEARQVDAHEGPHLRALCRGRGAEQGGGIHQQCHQQSAAKHKTRVRRQRRIKGGEIKTYLTGKLKRKTLVLMKSVMKIQIHVPTL